MVANLASLRHHHNDGSCLVRLLGGGGLEKSPRQARAVITMIT
jgi:hypothetical protein